MEDIIKNEVNNVKIIATLNRLDPKDMIMVLERALESDDRWIQWKEDHDSYRYSNRILSEVGKAVVEDDVAYKVSQLIYEGSPDRHTEPSLALDISIDTILEIKEPEEYDELLRQIRYMIIYDPLLRAEGYAMINPSRIDTEDISVLGLDKVGIDVDDQYVQRFEYNANKLSNHLTTLGIPEYLTNLLVYSSVKDPELAPMIIQFAREKMLDYLFGGTFRHILNRLRESHPADKDILRQIGDFLYTKTDNVEYHTFISRLLS